jgi:hypothetical protein
MPSDSDSSPDARRTTGWHLNWTVSVPETTASSSGAARVTPPNRHYSNEKSWTVSSGAAALGEGMSMRPSLWVSVSGLGPGVFAPLETLRETLPSKNSLLWNPRSPTAPAGGAPPDSPSSTPAETGTASPVAAAGSFEVTGGSLKPGDYWVGPPAKPPGPHGHYGIPGVEPDAGTVQAAGEGSGGTPEMQGNTSVEIVDGDRPIVAGNRPSEDGEPGGTPATAADDALAG